jgi:TRAP-type C4-dicarboxylate transport system permease small subunit
VDLVVSFMPPRVRARLDLTLSLIGLGAMIVVGWRGIIMVCRSYARGVRIPGILLTPVYLPQIVMVVGLLALVLQFIVEINKMAHTPQGSPKSEPDGIKNEEIDL